MKLIPYVAQKTNSLANETQTRRLVKQLIKLEDNPKPHIDKNIARRRNKKGLKSNHIKWIYEARLLLVLNKLREDKRLKGFGLIDSHEAKGKYDFLKDENLFYVGPKGLTRFIRILAPYIEKKSSKSNPATTLNATYNDMSFSALFKRIRKINSLEAPALRPLEALPTEVDQLDFIKYGEILIQKVKSEKFNSQKQRDQRNLFFFLFLNQLQRHNGYPELSTRIESNAAGFFHEARLGEAFRRHDDFEYFSISANGDNSDANGVDLKGKLLTNLILNMQVKSQDQYVKRFQSDRLVKPYGFQNIIFPINARNKSIDQLTERLNFFIKHRKNNKEITEEYLENIKKLLKTPRLIKAVDMSMVKSEKFSTEKYKAIQEELGEFTNKEMRLLAEARDLFALLQLKNNGVVNGYVYYTPDDPFRKQTHIAMQVLFEDNDGYVKALPIQFSKADRALPFINRIPTKLKRNHRSFQTQILNLINKHNDENTEIKRAFSCFDPNGSKSLKHELSLEPGAAKAYLDENYSSEAYLNRKSSSIAHSPILTWLFKYRYLHQEKKLPKEIFQCLNLSEKKVLFEFRKRIALSNSSLQKLIKGPMNQCKVPTLKENASLHQLRMHYKQAIQILQKSSKSLLPR